VRYKDNVDVFSKDMAETIVPNHLVDHMVDLDLGFNVPYGRICDLYTLTLQTLIVCIETIAVSEFIHGLSLLQAIQIIFARM
jgi:hypothetical protein